MAVNGQRAFYLSNRNFNGYIPSVTKKAFLGFRLLPELKSELERIAAREERSISQICEVLLRGGVEAYKKEGPRYLQRFLSKHKQDQQ